MRVNANALYSALLSDLSREIDVQLPSWAPRSKPRHVACYALRDSLLKKFNSEDKPSRIATDAALEKFRAVNKRCANWVIPYEHSIDELLIGELKNSLHNFWYHKEVPCVSSFNQLFHSGRAGPGSSVAARDSDFYTKMFDSPLTATSETLHFVWERMCTTLPLWSEASMLRKRSWNSSVVASSNYSFVNKTTTMARGICTEPAVNMWFQLGFGECLNRRLKSVYNYDPALQPDRNRVMTRRASIDGSFSTIDLESASDSMGLNVLKEILPVDFYNWLCLLRSPRTTLPNGEIVELAMVSTMGNGFTFPLQTLLFHSVVVSAYKLLGIPLDKGYADSDTCKDPFAVRRNFSCFGDDIIVDSSATRLVLRGLYLLGFVVNKDKTFVEGPFRESCGADYINGVNVRGVYIKSLNTQQDVCVAINTLNRWTAKTGVSLTNSVHVLLAGIHQPHRRLVPPEEDDAAGIHVPVRWLSMLNRPMTPFFLDKKGLRHPCTFVCVRPYTAWVPNSLELVCGEGNLSCNDENAKARNYNPPGLMLAALAGYIRGGRMLLRQRRVTYSTKPRTTPSWGWTRPRPLEYHIGYSGDRLFDLACDRNLSVSGLDGGG